MEFSDNESKAGRRGHRDFYEDAKEIEETRRQRNLITTASFSIFSLLSILTTVAFDPDKDCLVRRLPIRTALSQHTWPLLFSTWNIRPLSEKKNHFSLFTLCVAFVIFSTVHFSFRTTRQLTIEERNPTICWRPIT